MCLFHTGTQARPNLINKGFINEHESLINLWFKQGEIRDSPDFTIFRLIKRLVP